MKPTRILLLLGLGLVLSAFGGRFGDLTGTALAQEAKLLNSDCVKCHVDPPRDIEENGASHKTAVTCQDCHEGHPPKVLDIIPECSNCHSGTAHFELKGCLGCHTNPHRPLEITIGEDLTAPCLTCHEDEGTQLKEFPSHHSSLACTICHADKHPNVPECTNCHEPHTETMVEADCHRCHQAHKPLAVAYADDTPSTDCGACHDQVFATLTGSKTMHAELVCATCHTDQHGNIPQCTQCHEPHSEEMTADQCTLCHQAHDPLPVAYGSEVASANCGACHGEILQTLSTSQTKHQSLQCATCHADQHGNIPQCADCHEPHTEDMVQADCVSCHNAHKPLPVFYGDEIASKHCASCHEDAYGLLQASKAKHHELSCATCHQKKHKTVPACQDCHGKPHSPRMHEQFPTCGTCHNIAHDLMK